MQKKIWTKVTKSKVSKNEAEKLYKKLIQKDIDALEREKSNSIKKYNILKILENIGAYLHYGEVPKKTIVERNITEGVKLRRQRLDIINKKKGNINNELFNHYFSYLNPSIMLERLRDASDERNKNMVESVNKKLTKMKNFVKMCLKIKYLGLKRMRK